MEYDVRLLLTEAGTLAPKARKSGNIKRLCLELMEGILWWHMRLHLSSRKQRWILFSWTASTPHQDERKKKSFLTEERAPKVGSKGDTFPENLRHKKRVVQLRGVRVSWRRRTSDNLLLTRQEHSSVRDYSPLVGNVKRAPEGGRTA